MNEFREFARPAEISKISQDAKGHPSYDGEVGVITTVLGDMPVFVSEYGPQVG